MSVNDRIWEAVKTTDPKHTKSFSKGGGFKGTSINPTYNNQKATKLFGPCGIGWGVDIIKEVYQEGAPLFINGVPACKEIVHIIQIAFWYKQDGERGEIPSFGQTTFVGQNKNGIFTDEEAPKKSLTDATTKALSMLGFSADIFLGLYDDVKYLNDRKAEYSKPAKAPKVDDAAAEELHSDILSLLEVNKDAGKAAFLNWWNAPESKADRAMLKSLSVHAYDDVTAAKDAALLIFSGEVKA